MNAQKKYDDKGKLTYFELSGIISECFSDGVIIVISEKNAKGFFKDIDVKMQFRGHFKDTDNIPEFKKGDKIKIILQVNPKD